jgi:hypothetical protein
MRRVARFLCCVLALWCLPACATLSGDEWLGISPSEFHFVPIVPLRGKGPGGWMVARVVITKVPIPGARVTSFYERSRSKRLK